jgi:hypothetical protein
MDTSPAVPRFALSTRSSPLLGPAEYARIVQRASIAGLDVDLVVSGWRRHALRGSPPRGVAAASLWVPASADSRSPDFVAPWVERAALVIVEEAGDGGADRRIQLGAAIRLREVVPATVGVALAVRPRNAEGGRSHLVRLSMLRNLAEEWDLGLALDLTGSIDWLWEAEAAVARMMPRLRLLRLLHPLPALDGHVRARLTQRTIAACADNGYDGWISIVAALPVWRWRSADALERAASAATERLAVKFGLAPASWQRGVSQRSSAP